MCIYSKNGLIFHIYENTFPRYNFRYCHILSLFPFSCNLERYIPQISLFCFYAESVETGDKYHIIFNPPPMKDISRQSASQTIVPLKTETFDEENAQSR